MSGAEDFIKVKTSIPELEKRIHININDPKEKIFWNIKFNLRLDETSLTSDNMYVTDKEGYILKTNIAYRRGKNFIVVSPLEDYIENQYYILNITKDVRSEKLNNLKNDIHILFKIKGNTVADFIILPPNVVVPQPKLRKISDNDTKKTKEDEPTASRVYSFEKLIDKSDLSRQLPFAEVRLNPFIGIAGIILTIGSLFLNNIYIMAGCGILALGGLAHIIYQVTRKDFRSSFIYNIGVRFFNKEDYLKAEKFFDKAIRLNSNNEYAEYAKSKMTYYKE